MNLDITNLRRITGGNTLVESELFQIFLESASECMTFLHEAVDCNNEGVWKTQAHAFKGISYSIGADELGRLCKDAQENYMLPVEIKRQLLAKIEKEFASVEQEIKGRMV